MEEDNNSYFIKMKEEELKKEEKIQKIINDTYEDLLTNPKYKVFFEQYKADAIKEFIKDYAREKGEWIKHGEMFLMMELRAANQFRDHANDGLWEIQQKKLFNMQCLWRAEKIELDGVESIYDFIYWEHAIKICPFLDSISEDEVDLYKMYLLSNNVDIENNNWLGWQSYDQYKSNYLGDNDECNLPEWYEFFDGRKGTGSLFLLPDIRGNKEKEYLVKGRDYLQEVRTEIYTALEPVRDPRPYLHSSDEVMDFFIENFEEDELIKEYHKLDRKKKKTKGNYDIDVTEITHHLDEIDELIPIKDHWNWKEAIEQAWHDYPIIKTYRSMDSAYEDYLFRLNSGIPFEQDKEESDHIKSGAVTTKLLKEMVLEGRRLKGEPEDFNF